jgi:DinB superfamily
MMASEAHQLQSDLKAGRERLLSVIDGLSEGQSKRRPKTAGATAEEWSVAEILAHLLSQENLRAGRIAVALEDDGAAIVLSPPEMHEQDARAGRSAPVPQLINGLRASRLEVERLLERASRTEGGLDRGVEHPLRGRETIGYLIREKITAHESEHVTQIERVKQTLAPAPSA